MFKIVIYNDKNLKFARIANNTIKFVSLKTILINKDSFELSYGLALEDRFLSLLLKKLPFKEKVSYNVWYKDHSIRPTFLECLAYLVNMGFISPNIKGIKL